MKTLAVLRHAKSSWDDSSLADFDRPLNGRGRKAATRVGREVKRRKFDYVLASPARRVRETLERFAEGYDKDLPITFEQRIYESSTTTLFELVNQIPDDAKSALLVGHNPTLENFVPAISRDDRKGLRNKAGGKFPTSALAIIELDVDRWSDVGPASGEIVDLILPRELD